MTLNKTTITKEELPDFEDIVPETKQAEPKYAYYCLSERVTGVLMGDRREYVMWLEDTDDNALGLAAPETAMRLTSIEQAANVLFNLRKCADNTSGCGVKAHVNCQVVLNLGAMKEARKWGA
jgi:transcription initiation factor IIE alpha subunit